MHELARSDPSESLRHALESREFGESVLADERDAAALGVSGVPAYIANRITGLSGVQHVENLRNLVAHVRGAND